MSGTTRNSALDTITGADADGRSVTILLGSVLAVTPDREHADRTLLHVADGIVSVDGDYEDWMSRLSSGWTGAKGGPTRIE